MSNSTRLRAAFLVFVSFVGVALFQAWPLPLHLGTHLTGNPSGDTGVYVWNTWLFAHLLGAGVSPFSTDRVFALGGPIDLSLHNYTVFADLLALPLGPLLGVVAAFNVIYLLNVALAGCGMYLMVRSLFAGVGVGEAWLSALLFACSPFIVARGNGHYSVAAAAPLPFFVVCFNRLLDRPSPGAAAGSGACVAWAWYCDPYFAIYCVVLALCLMLARVVSVRRGRPADSSWRWFPRIDIPIAAIVAAILIVHVASGGQLSVGHVSISMRTLYSPVLVLTALLLVRWWITYRPRATWTLPSPLPYLVPFVVLAAVAAMLLAPELYGIARRASEGRMVPVPVMWRSSAPGIDVLSFLLPNPNHPLTPASIVDWIRRQPGENMASIPWVALAVIAFAWRGGHRLNRAWVAMAIGFLLLALGPFVRFAGWQTAIPTPWTLLRYVPVLGEARMPARFAVLVILAVCVLFAGALAALARRWPDRRRAVLWTAGAALAFELLPAPRPLHAVAIPPAIAALARQPGDGVVLQLPFGIRDGLTTLGGFDPVSLVHQTAHGKRLVEGYLSRVAASRIDLYLDQPFVAALIAQSEGAPLTDEERLAAAAAAPDFAREVSLDWVIVDEHRATPGLQALAIGALGLELLERDGRYALYAKVRDAGE